MKPTNVKSFNRTLLAASIGMIGIAAPVTALADDDEMRRLTQPVSEVEVGIVNVSEGSYKFGDYTGLRDNKAYGNANVSVIRRGEADATYLEIEGRDLGLDSRNLSVEGGEQGNYGLRFGYGELPKYITGDFYSPYSGMGSSRLVAPAGWLGTIDRTPGGAINAPIDTTNLTTAMMTQLGASMKPYDIETKRKDLSLGFSKVLPAGWDFDFDYKHKKKEGDKLRGAVVQNADRGTRFAVLVPDPIDYTDDQFSAIARYADEKLQLQFGYQVSIFKNHASALVFDNLAYNPLSAANGGASPTGRLGTMPDNEAHQISASANYRFSKDTSLSGSLSIGRMTQDDKFLPYTSLNQVGLTPLPANSLDGDVDTKHFDIRLVSKLTKAIKLTAGYRYDDRDNNTDVYQFRYQTGDNSNLANYANSASQSTRRWNMPMDKNKQVLYGDLDFHLAKGTTLKVGYDYDRIDHNYEPTGGDTEQTYKAEIKHQFNDMASGGLAYSHSKRDAERYDGGLALQDTYNSVYLASLCAIGSSFVYKGVTTACTTPLGNAAGQTTATSPWLDTPALRKYFLTDRKRDKLRGFANVTPIENLELQFMGHYFADEYPDADDGYGLTRAKGTSLSIDGSLKATDQITGTFFLAYDKYKTDQNGHNGSTTNLERQNNAAAFQAATFGEVSIDDSSWAAGLGFLYKPGGQYEWGGDYNYVKTNTDIGFSNLGTALVATVKPVPDGKTKRHRLDLFGRYTIDKEWAVRANYTYERFTSDDWAWDGQTQNRSTNFILPGITSPNYNVHVVGVMVSYKFQ